MNSLSRILKITKYKTQKRNKCSLCGKSRSFHRFFKSCRCCIRKLISSSLIPGINKSSW